MVPQWEKMDPEYLNHIIRDRGVTNMSAVPAVYSRILDNAGKEDLASLRFVVLGGEDPGSYLLNKSLGKYPHITLINEYGPTETTIAAAANTTVKKDMPAIIGKPIANTHIYILDRLLGPLPPRGPGRTLYIRGRCLRRIS